MISDTLYNTCEEIRAYQHSFPHIYEEIRFDLNVLLAQMELLQHKLDSSPSITQGEQEHDIDADLLTVTDQPSPIGDKKGPYADNGWSGNVQNFPDAGGM
jgi:hypothetical protein